MADKDISQSLYDKISRQFERNLTSSKEASQFFSKIVKGSPSYADAEKYADAIGAAMTSACDKYLTSAALPDGKLTIEMGEKIVDPLMKDEYKHATDAATKVQKSKNTKANIHLAPRTTDYDTKRVNEVIEKMSVADQYDDVAWVMRSLAESYPLSVVDGTMKSNIDFQGSNGYRGKIIRRASSKCCAWCQDLEGEYDYPLDDQSTDVYKRHDNCRCAVDYEPVDHKGQYQDVWDQGTKRTEEEAEILEDRKTYGLERTWMKTKDGKNRSKRIRR